MKQIQYSVSAVRKKNRWSVSAYFKGTREIADAHFLNDNINTWQLGAHSQVFGADVKIDLDAIMLPLSRGYGCLLYTSPSPRDRTRSRMPSSA